MASDAVSELPTEGWYAIIDGEQIGPVSRDAIIASVRAGQAGPDTYVWREGFAEWKQLSNVAGFAELLAGVPTAAPDSNEGTVAASEAREPDRAAGSMFDVPDAHPRRPLLHQRHDTSVLFSLDALDEGDSAGRKAVAAATGVTLGDVPGGLIDVRKVGREETKAAAARQTTGDIFGDFDEPDSPRTPTEEIEMELPAPVEPLVEERRRPVWPFVVGGVVLLVAGAGVGYFVMAHLGAGAAAPRGAKTATAQAPHRQSRAAEPSVSSGKEARTAEAAVAEASPRLASASPMKDERVAGAGPPPAAPVGGAPPAAGLGAGAAGGPPTAAQAAKPVGASPSKPAEPKPSAARSKAKSRGERASREHKVASRAVKKSPRSTSLERARSATAAVVRRTSSPGAPKKAPSREATALLEVLTASEAHHAPAKPAPQPQAGATASSPTAQGASHSMRQRLSSSQVRRSLARRQKAMAQCYSGEASGPVLVHVKLDIAGSGKVLTASVTGGLSDPAAAGCIERVLRRIEFPPFQASHQIVTTAVRIR